MCMKRTTVYYDKPGEQHTEETLKIAIEAAKARDIETVLVASTTGKTALKAMEMFEGSHLNLVIVTHQVGWRKPGVQVFLEEAQTKLEEAGIAVVTCTDALAGGVDIGISRQRQEKNAPLNAKLPFIVPPVNRIISSTLKLFTNPVKVCVSIAMMAADVGVVPVDKPLISVAGSHAGSDTALVLTPSTTNRILDLKVHEILVKTY